MINMFSLVRGRANFILQATNIDHVNVSELFKEFFFKSKRIERDMLITTVLKNVEITFDDINMLLWY